MDLIDFIHLSVDVIHEHWALNISQCCQQATASPNKSYKWFLKFVLNSLVATEFRLNDLKKHLQLKQFKNFNTIL